jgi:hypothetical protein
MKNFLRRSTLLLLFFPVLAFAWGPTGHRIVAELAEQRLSPKALAETKRLLATSGQSTLADVASWADDVRSDPKQRQLARATSKMHFINFTNASCHYDPARDCPNGQCVVGGIEKYAAILRDRSRPDRERAEALRFIVHFVGDVHQPLHAGYRKDRGGNDYQIQLDGKGTNLHSIWDSPVLASRKLGWKKYAQALRLKPGEKAKGNAREWAEESCRITRDGGLYPRGHKLDKRYLDKMRPVAEKRVRLAALRLAKLLNDSLG